MTFDLAGATQKTKMPCVHRRLLQFNCPFRHQCINIWQVWVFVLIQTRGPNTGQTCVLMSGAPPPPNFGRMCPSLASQSVSGAAGMDSPSDIWVLEPDPGTNDVTSHERGGPSPVIDATVR